MTATPIPRTLAMTLYGDLDLSVIDEMPPGRTPIRTIHVTERDADRDLPDARQTKCARDGSATSCYPVIEESEKVDLKSATEGFEKLPKVSRTARVALLHGRLKSDEKEAIMRAFAAGEIDVLVSTTVIEVGVDVANATVMLIEHAERFGLAQLHQLRGRVGRGSEASLCVLMTPAQDQRYGARADPGHGFDDGRISACGSRSPASRARRNGRHATVRPSGISRRESDGGFCTAGARAARSEEVGGVGRARRCDLLKELLRRGRAVIAPAGLVTVGIDARHLGHLPQPPAQRKTAAGHSSHQRQAARNAVQRPGPVGRGLRLFSTAVPEWAASASKPSAAARVSFTSSISRGKPVRSFARTSRVSRSRKDFEFSKTEFAQGAGSVRA